MIKKLKAKFIAIALASVFAILFVIILAINLVNYSSINNEGDKILDILIDYGGSFPSSDHSTKATSLSNGSITPETPYSTRYFSVVFDSDGQVTSVDTNYIFALDDKETKDEKNTEAINIATDLFNSKQSSGYYNYYKYRAASKSNNSTLYVFVDRENEIKRFQAFLLSSTTISAGGFTAFAALIIFLSHFALKPAIEGEKKQKMFITNASHSLKTPLAVIQADNEVIQTLNGPTKWTSSISTQVDKMSKLTNQLVYLSRLDEGSLKRNDEEFDLSGLLADSLESFKPVYENLGIKVTSSIEPNIKYKGDIETFSELISIFLENASKYAKDKSWVDVKLYRKRGIHLIFSNAISYSYSGDPNHLFDRFYQADPSRNSKKGGTGLGLSIAKAIVTNYKGKIKATVKSDVDISFEIIL